MLRELVSQSDTHLTRGSTYDNSANLPARFLAKLTELYEGTRVGRQEVYAELFTDVEGALFGTRMFDDNRLKMVPPNVQLERVVVAVDPPATSGEKANLAGIIVVGKGDDGHAYVLADRSVRGPPDVWGRAAVEAYISYDADRIVAEINQGGEMVEHVVRSIMGDVSYKGVHATRGKVVRAEPVSALYEQRKVHHVGPSAQWEPMEGQLLLFAPGVKFEGEHSPDRADALVWAMTDLYSLGEIGDLINFSYRT